MFARLIAGAAAGLFRLITTAGAQVPEPNPHGPKASWALYDKYSTANLWDVTYSTTVTPRWIGETDSVFYEWHDHTGEHWCLVNAALRTKKPLFDHAKLAAQLSVLKKKAVEAYALNEQFTTMNITKDHKNLRFANVYLGPQTESVNTAFVPGGGPQRRCCCRRTTSSSRWA